MRRLSCLTGFFFLFFYTITAQFSPDCRSAIPICADMTLDAIDIQGRGDVNDFEDLPDGETSGCLEKSVNGSQIGDVENNTIWYVFRADFDGQLGFDIEALSVTAEWDFAVYGPDVDCAGIGNGTVQPVRCNFEINTTDYTGIGVNPENGQVGAAPLSGSQNTYDEWLDVRAGEIYYILVNNFAFSSNPESFELTFTENSAVDPATTLDCAFRDEFLGLDIIACDGDPDIMLSALRSPAGASIDNITWSRDTTGDGFSDTTLLSGPMEFELVVSSPNSGRYFVEILTTGTPQVTISDDILITFFSEPILDEVRTVDTVVSNIETGINSNSVEIIVDGDSTYEYALNNSGEFQDSPIFDDVPPGVNTVTINDINGCGTIDEDFLVVGYPKFFTPNGDIANDAWNVFGLETLINPSVFIFDRYGKLLKQLTQNSPPWDGTFNGADLPSSDYWFKLEYTENLNGDLKAKTRTGHFTLKR